MVLALDNDEIAALKLIISEQENEIARLEQDLDLMDSKIYSLRDEVNNLHIRLSDYRAGIK